MLCLALICRREELADGAISGSTEMPQGNKQFFFKCRQFTAQRLVAKVVLNFVPYMRHHAAHLNFTRDTTDVDVGSNKFSGWQEHFAVCRPIKMRWILGVPVLHLQSRIFPVMTREALAYLFRNLLLVLDVSPSMRLQDAGPTGKQSRRKRAADLLKSFFERIPIDHYRTTVLAVYTGAKPVVVATTDLEIVRNILNDLPMEYAFKSGPTNLFAGLEEAAKMARPWRPKSTILLVVSDGDTVPATGLPLVSRTWKW